MEGSIALKISESIKTGRWLSISYQNQKKEITYYWIAVKDINLKTKLITATIFNEKKFNYECKEATLHFEGILTAHLLDFTCYDVPSELINKIETHRAEAAWLEYDKYNNNILKYFIECNELDNDPFQKEYCLIEGVDKDVLLKNKEVVVNNAQKEKILGYIFHYDIKALENSNNLLIMSALSIDDDNKKYVVLYYVVNFNPSKSTISINPTIRVNQTFLIEDKKHTLSSYIDIDPNEFVNNITNHYEDYYHEYVELIRENLRGKEIINELPEFMILSRTIPANLVSSYSVIDKKYEENRLTVPLKAFFGNSDRRTVRGKIKEPSIVVYDRKVNIDQMRVIHNTMKYPITYVQGPPGTGKTQTILNVILSAFFNEKTVLVCSSNNRPVDGIIEKLSFTYKTAGDVLFPYLRLGNRVEIAKSTLRIKELYGIKSKLEPDDSLLERNKRHNDAVNKQLVEDLEIYEKKKDLAARIANATKLLSRFNTKDIRFYRNLDTQLDKMKLELSKLPEVTNDDVLNLVTSASEDRYFKQYIYFESLKHIKKLKLPKYKELISICSIEDEVDRVSKFNSWCQFDENIKMLADVFPVIMTTNISASRLGTPEHTFDLVIMDEAGQCNCATALLPISRAQGLLLVGDSNQLKPVVLLEDVINDKLKQIYTISDDYDYKKNSILELMRNHDKISRDIMLTYHYRCGRKIINFSNKRFYDSKLNLDYLNDEGSLELIDVKNMNSRYKNENYEEAKAIVDYVERNKLKDVAIITPFINQQKLINSFLEDKGLHGVTCGTIHSVQGAEKDTIIISASISPKTSKRTFEWIKNNSEITNVAVTRAKKRLIVAADVESLDKMSDKSDDLYNLVKYVKSNGTTNVPANESVTIQIGASNGSKNEDMFYNTISQFCSVYKYYSIKRNVKLSEIFKGDPMLKKSKLEFDAVLYQNKNTEKIPKVAIEIQGGEHYGDFNREMCDARKSAICKEKGIILLEIPNSFVKSYETIKEMILISCGEEVEQLEMVF